MSQRIVVLDTETTGLSYNDDRIVEIGAVILDGVSEIDKMQFYFDPQCPVSPGAYKIHGLSNSFLSRFSSFCVKKVSSIIQNSPLVIHNAKFDMHFLNKEFLLAGKPEITNQVTDTLQLARKAFPGAPANLDALCARFKIPNNHRNLHGALVDAILLARVYKKLRSFEANNLTFSQSQKPAQSLLSNIAAKVNLKERDSYTEMMKKIHSD